MVFSPWPQVSFKEEGAGAGFGEAGSRSKVLFCSGCLIFTLECQLCQDFTVFAPFQKDASILKAISVFLNFTSSVKTRRMSVKRGRIPADGGCGWENADNKKSKRQKTRNANEDQAPL